MYSCGSSIWDIGRGYLAVIVDVIHNVVWLRFRDYDGEDIRMRLPGPPDEEVFKKMFMSGGSLHVDDVRVGDQGTRHDSATDSGDTRCYRIVYKNVLQESLRLDSKVLARLRVGQILYDCGPEHEVDGNLRVRGFLRCRQQWGYVTVRGNGGHVLAECVHD